MSVLLVIKKAEQAVNSTRNTCIKCIKSDANKITNKQSNDTIT
jgi:hypothetical protein